MVEMDTPIHGIISKGKVNHDFELFKHKLDEKSIVDDIMNDSSSESKT